MAHYAFINDNNEVVKVITGVDENIVQINSDGKEVGGSTESWENFYASLPWFSGLRCKRTSYSANGNGFRKNYAGTGDFYDEERDAFISPQPYPSWTLNETTCKWEPPIPMPQITKEYTWIWSEDLINWIKN